MSRVARTLPVSAKMYRHFAVATVAITVCVAMFADGETRATVTDEIEQQQTRRALAEHEVNQLGAGRKALGALRVKPQGSGWGGGGGESGGGGTGMLPGDYTIVPTGAVLLDPLAARTGGANLPRVLPSGMAPGDNADPGSEAASNSRRVGAARQLSAEQLERINAASRARSGGSEQGGD